MGRRGIGYEVDHIVDALNDVLGLGSQEPIILIGVGNLGKAILKYNRWQYTVGKIVCGLEKTFPKNCNIAILAISENVQETVDRLMDLGIKGIVDFTHTHFLVREGIEVQPVDVVVAIQELVLRMKANKNEENI